MRRSAASLVGTHDFRGFATEADRMEDTVRTLSALRVVRTRVGVRIFATSNGFLQHMVRTLAGGLLRVGNGLDDVDRPAEILLARDRRRGPAALPAHGLFFVEGRLLTRQLGCFDIRGGRFGGAPRAAGRPAPAMPVSGISLALPTWEATGGRSSRESSV